jgi:noggin
MVTKHRLLAAVFVVTLASVVTSSTNQQPRHQQRHGSGTSAILPAHVVLKSDAHSPSAMNLARPGRLGAVDTIGGDTKEDTPGHRQRGQPTASGRRGRPTFVDYNEEDEQLQRQIGHSSALRLRPSPDDSIDGLPVLPLLRRQRPSSMSPSSTSLDPSPADLDARLLSSLLGADYDATFMSPLRPPDSILYPNGSFLLYREDFLADNGRGSKLPRLPAIRVPGRSSSSTTTLTAAVGREARHRLKRYLAAYSHCPLFVRWRDLGRRFWPRWIREGSCRGQSSGTGSGKAGVGRERSCSIPAGMTCRPNRSSTKTVLWWHCRTPSTASRHNSRQTVGAAGHSLASPSASGTSGGNSSGGGSICGWIPIKYPVITDCKCAC